MTTPCGESVGLRGRRTVLGLGSFSEDVSGDGGPPRSQARAVTDRAVRSWGMSRSPNGLSPHRFGTPKECGSS
eukprot:2531470-Pyramimonas_sp.AAC.1